jgi:DNA repair exonuclease SbcCD ATPase subunit
VSSTPTYVPPPEPQRTGLITALITGAIIALVAANIYLYVQIDHIQTDMANMAKTQEALRTDLNNLKDASSVTTAAEQRHLEAMKEELEAARNQARTLSSQAKAEAQAHADQLAKAIQAEENRMQQQVSSQISEAKESASTAVAATNAKVADVSTDVGNVKSAQAQTQAQLDKTISELKSVTGDLGVASGLIATNSKELAALRLHGERNYLDIKLGKTKQPVRFGDITMKLDNADAKHNKYSVDIRADDKLVTKKDKNINEPVQFYTSKGGHIPYELVINSVTKNEIVGYLSTPKEMASR